VLFLYGNYSGDVLNFDLAAEELMDDGIEVATVRISDDVASAPVERRAERRGIAGDLFVIKAAGAAAEERLPLAEVKAAAERASENTRSMGVALSSCTIPASGKPIFSLPENEMEIGMGLHGEPGVQRGPMRSAHELMEYMVQAVVRDLELRTGEEVGVLLNGLGATPLSELFIAFRSVTQLLDAAGIRIARSYVGNYATSLDMAGCSISFMRLDKDLKRWLTAPCAGPGILQT